MTDQYAGWNPLIEKIKALGEEFEVQVHIQPKAGYLRASAPSSAPLELTRLLDTIEELSAVICQFCGLSGATERQRQAWIYTVCPSSTWVSLADGAVGTSCAL